MCDDLEIFTEVVWLIRYDRVYFCLAYLIYPLHRLFGLDLSGSYPRGSVRGFSLHGTHYAMYLTSHCELEIISSVCLLSFIEFVNICNFYLRGTCVHCNYVYREGNGLGASGSIWRV